MIRVTVELVSAIHPSRNKVLGIATIANVGPKTQKTNGAQGDYTASFSKMQPKQNETWKSGKVFSFDRVHRGAWDLLFLALRSAIGDRNR